MGIGTAVIMSAFTASLAGFLFGFDTVVISGAEQKIQALWELSPGLHGVAMGSALYGTVAGSLCGGWAADRFGRRATLLWTGVLYLICAVGSALAGNVQQLIAARLVGGLGIGISTVAAPLYIAEIAPAEYRGRLAGMFQFNIVLGIVVAYASNALLAGIGENAWRWMMGVAAFPSLLFLLLGLKLPESPRWLQGREEIRNGPPDACPSRFWTRALSRPIMLAILVAVFNQLSGINAILYFAPRIFELTGLSRHAALLESMGIGITNLVFTFAGLWLIDRVGRRTLLLIGSFGYIASLGLVAWAFFTSRFAIVPTCVFVFIASHAVGQGTVIWVLIAEVFPTRHRAEGQALGSFTHWTMAALVTSAFPWVVSAFAPGDVFAFFCAMMILQLIWVTTTVVETKGVPLESMQSRLGPAPGRGGEHQ